MLELYKTIILKEEASSRIQTTILWFEMAVRLSISYVTFFILWQIPDVYDLWDGTTAHDVLKKHTNRKIQRVENKLRNIDS